MLTRYIVHSAVLVACLVLWMIPGHAMTFPGIIKVDTGTVVFTDGTTEAVYNMPCSQRRTTWGTPIQVQITLNPGYTTSAATSFTMVADYAGDYTANIQVLSPVPDTVNYKLIIRRRIPLGTIPLVLQKDHSMFVLDMLPKRALADSGYVKVYIPGPKESERPLLDSLTLISQQWYKDGALVEGAKQTYFFEPGDIPLSSTAEYALQFTIRKGTTFMTCPLPVITKDNSSGGLVPTEVSRFELLGSVFPTRVTVGGTVYVEPSEQLTAGGGECVVEATLLNMQGGVESRYTYRGVGGFMLQMPYRQGIYLLHLKFGNKSQLAKIYCY